MQISRNKLLVTLVLVSVALLVLSSASSAAPRIDKFLERTWSTGTVVKAPIASLGGEPEGGGGGTPQPTVKYSSVRSRSEVGVVSVRGYGSWWTLISRVWAARYWGITF
jgi:hypothetical protein